MAHRLSSLRNFDRIVVLRSGRVIEDGSPDQLIKRKGVVCREMSRLLPVLAERPHYLPDCLNSDIL
jgi:ATP-binding cassette subfamily B protein